MVRSAVSGHHPADGPDGCGDGTVMGEAAFTRAAAPRRPDSVLYGLGHPWCQWAGHISMPFSTCCAQLPAGQAWVFWSIVSSRMMVAEWNAVRMTANTSSSGHADDAAGHQMPSSRSASAFAPGPRLNDIPFAAAYWPRQQSHRPPSCAGTPFSSRVHPVCPQRPGAVQTGVFRWRFWREPPTGTRRSSRTGC